MIKQRAGLRIQKFVKQIFGEVAEWLSAKLPLVIWRDHAIPQRGMAEMQ